MIDAKIKQLKIDDYSKNLDRENPYDFRSLDLSEKDYPWEELLSPTSTKNLTFDTKTKFPKSVSQKFFDMLEKAKNRGLGVNSLHQKGYTGKGATVAIIDQPLLTSHKEVRDNIIHYEEIGKTSENASYFEYAQYHGISVSSILCGKNIGVIPDAKLVYFATKGGNIDAHLDAISRVIEYNKTLPDNEKIHTLSISFGICGEKSTQEQKDYSEKLVKLANENDIFIISPSLYRTHNLNFLGCDRNISRDLDDPNNYSAGLFWKNPNSKIANETLLVPMDRISYGSFCGNDDYIYTTTCGLSQATPYLAGVYALAKNEFPNLTPQKFFDVAFSSGLKKEIQEGHCSIINCENLIKTLEFENASDKILNKQNNNNITLDNTNDR